MIKYLAILFVIPFFQQKEDGVFSLNSNVFEVGDVLSKQILFDYDNGKILSESYPFLDSLVVFLNENTFVQIEIGCNTGYYGNENYNKNLTKRRASQIQSYLHSKSIPEFRITPVGYGETNLIITQKESESAIDKQTQTDHYFINSRTEFKILKIQ